MGLFVAAVVKNVISFLSGKVFGIAAFVQTAATNVDNG